ncbi:PAS domain-containing sensor histidine kinase [Candidatus Odyssella thessalonicensis]|uniref:PAS domain-containing sensor histidine kinase n=1 Tax=Candidatus Odyssella thessalonicensis TaxID=84647 RepID=UPI000225AEDF|nr:ATP-binding protein [Candidatus Odyssella thessalonicensis]
MASFSNIIPLTTSKPKSAQEDTIYRESILRHLSKRFNGGIINVDAHGFINAISDEFLELVGQYRADLIGKNIADFIGKNKFEMTFMTRINSLIEGKLKRLEFGCVWATDSHKANLYIELYPPVDHNGIIEGFVQKTYATQISFPRQEIIEQIIQHMSAVVWLSPITAGELYYVSPSFKEYYGITPEDYVKDPSLFLNRIHPDDLENLMKCYDPEASPSVRQGYFRYKLENGSWRHTSFYRFPIYNGKGDIVKFAGIAVDSSPLYEAQEQARLQQDELLKVNQELKKTNEMLEEFTTFACHDLAQPLRAFKIYTEILENNYLQDIDEEGNLMLSSIKAAMERMEDLIKGIGTLAQMGTKPLKAPSQSLNITNLIEKTLVPLYSSPINPTCQIEKGKLHPIRIREQHMAVILENLITNSVKYTEKFPHIRIRSKRFSGATVYAVSDNGIGIPQEAEDYIFKLGKRLRTKPEKTGSGIGLSACQKIMSLYGGKIWFHSKPGEGSTFYLLFPENNVKEATQP